MKLVYFGSSEFSKKLLSKLITRGIKPQLVVTLPDRVQGRGLKKIPNPLKVLAQLKDLKFVTTDTLNVDLEASLKNFNPDLFLVVSYGKIIPKCFLQIPRIMPIGLHPSLLPKLRGPAPINWALIRGERESGITIFKVTEEVDGGPIILQRRVIIEEEDNYFTLFSKLVELSAEGIEEALDLIKKGGYSLLAQRKEEVSWAPKLKKDDGRINWHKSAEEIRNLIRGMVAWPSAYTFWRGKRMQILSAEVLDTSSELPPASIINFDKTGIYVATGRGILKIKKLKLEGKKEMWVENFLCGYRIERGEEFE